MNTQKNTVGVTQKITDEYLGVMFRLITIFVMQIKIGSNALLTLPEICEFCRKMMLINKCEKVINNIIFLLSVFLFLSSSVRIKQSNNSQGIKVALKEKFVFLKYAIP